MRSFVLGVALVAGLCGAAAAATEARDLLQRGIARYRDAAYAESVALLEQARLKGALEPEQKVECAFYLAANYVALGSTAAARRELKTVLTDEPGYELPLYTSPKVAALFRDVQQELERAPRLRPLPPERQGAMMRLGFEASRTGGRAFGAVSWRWRGERNFREAPLGHGPGPDELSAEVPVRHGGMLEYYAEGRAPNGPLAAGSAARPLELPVAGPGAAAALALDPAAMTTTTADAAPAHPSKARKLWWLWTSLGAVAAAGAGVGLYFALRPSPGGTADAVLGFQVR